MKRSLTLLLAASTALGGNAAAFEDTIELYNRHCARCHGANGHPIVPDAPDFSRGDSLMKGDQDLIQAIRFGVRTMPGFEHLLTREEILDVLFYVQSLQR